jgi:multiple sugar transport system permease protein/sn-glycerol 3-phosphate transport system permease protein
MTTAPGQGDQKILVLPAPSRAAGLLASKRRQRRLHRALIYAVLLPLAALILVPLFWMVTTSLKRQMDVYLVPPQWLPAPPQWTNYSDLFTFYPLHVYAWNTTIITALSIIGTLLSCSLAAYGFARLRAPGRDVIFIVLLSTLMLPSVVTLVPTYILFQKLGWVNTFLPLIVPNFFGSAFYIFLLRQFMMTISLELEDAARIDGASSFGIWWRIMLPLVRPALLMSAVFTFQTNWNDYLGPLIYINDENKRTLALALSYFTGSPRGGPQLHYLMAASFLSLLPLIVVFFLAQRTMIRGIVFTGLKG